MDLFEAMLLGLVQGLTEFLPVSSSGHLSLVQRELGWQPEGTIAFDVVVHLGTLLAIVIAYRQTLLSLFTSRRRAILPLVVGTLPLGAAVFAKPVVESFKGSYLLLGLSFLVTAGMLIAADAPFIKRAEPEVERLEELTWQRALLVGVFQLLAVLPGVSRSGSTISCALFSKVEALTAAELSFLLAIPAISGAGLLEARKITELAGMDPWPLVAGFLTALITGLLALWLLKLLLKNKKFWVFAPYLLLVGGYCLVRHLSA